MRRKKSLTFRDKIPLRNIQNGDVRLCQTKYDVIFNYFLEFWTQKNDKLRT